MDRHPVLGALRSAGKSSCAQTVVGSSPTLPHHVLIAQLVEAVSSNLIQYKFESYWGHQKILYNILLTASEQMNSILEAG